MDDAVLLTSSGGDLQHALGQFVAKCKTPRIRTTVLPYKYLINIYEMYFGEGQGRATVSSFLEEFKKKFFIHIST